MYHPSVEQQIAAGGTANLEWIEIYNEDPTVRDLSGYYFSNGIDFTFPPGTYLEGRSYLVVAADAAAVRALYGITNVIGDFDLRLDNGGETIALNIFGGGPEARVGYSDRNQWPHAADGTGHTLVLSDVYLDPDDNDSWTWSPQLGGTPGAPNFDEPRTEVTTLLEEDATWRYRKGTSPYPAGWRDAGFDASSWASGPTGIGYGDGDDRTELTDMQGSYISFAARHELELTAEELETLDTMGLEVSFDDGFIFWINGNEVVRAGLTGAAGTDVPYDASASSHEASGYESYSFPKSLLREGINILAAQVHNTSSGSSDCSFIPRLVSTRVIEPGGGGDPVPVAIHEAFVRGGGSEESWVELHNESSGETVDLSGFHLSDDRNDLGRYTFPAGTLLAPGGLLLVTATSSGLTFAGEEVGIYLTRPDLDGVVAAEAFENPLDLDPAFIGTSDALWPDGSGGLRFFVSTTPTPGAPNEVEVVSDLVIHELMYHPPRERASLEYVELLNRGADPLDISSFRFNRGISYTFPPGTVVPAGGYVVVALDPEALAAAHPDVPSSSILGPYDGRLDDSGELVRIVDHWGNIVDQVRYFDGGRWSGWADGGGSSLELLDPWQDNSVASAWEASDESAKSSWEEVSFSITGYSQQQESEFQIRMQSAAEVLVDDIHLTRDSTEYISNGDFETTTSPWIIDGTHIRSHRTMEDSYTGRACLKVVASSHGDLRVNRIETETSTIMRSGSYEARLAVRWLRGGNLIYLSGYRHPNSFQHTYWMEYPLDLGSPGKPNSVGVANLGPVISEVRHHPAVPGPNQLVTIRARVSDSDGIASVAARYRLGSSGGAYDDATLYDDGAHGDDAAGDGIYAGQVTGQARGQRVVFYIEARDAAGAERTFPREAPDRTLVYQHDNPLTARSHVYRVIHDEGTWSFLNSRELHSNDLLDATFVFGEDEVYYNVGTRYRGSPWNRPGNPRMYRIKFGPDHTYRGRGAINLSRYGNALRERAAYYAVWRNSTRTTPSPKSRSAFARVRTSAGTFTMEHIEPVNRDYLKLWFPGDSDGFLFKITGRQVFSDAGDHQSNFISWTDYQYRGNFKGAYRWYYNIRSRDVEDNYSHLMDWLLVMAGSSTTLDRDLDTVMDVEQFLRVYAARCAHDDWDTIAIGNGQNAYVYFAEREGRWKLIPWDMDHSWSNTSARIYPDADTRFRAVINRPKYRRIYLGILNEMVNGRGSAPGHWNSSEMVSKYLDVKYREVGADGVQSASPVRSFINGRVSRLASQVPADVPFAITTNGGEDLAVNAASTRLDGTAWVDVHSILVNEEPVSPTWVSTTRWRIDVELDAGDNDLTLLAFDADGNFLAADEIRVTSTFGWATPTVESVDPAEGMPGEMVEIVGTEFHEGIEMLLNGTPSSLVVFDEATDPGRLSAEVPLLPPSEVELTVRNVDGRESEPVAFQVLSLPPQFVRGDINIDGGVDISDPIRILGYLFAGLDAPCRDAGDANDDERIEIADAILLLEFLFRDGPAPTAPFPEMGYDGPDGPELDCLEGLDPFADR